MTDRERVAARLVSRWVSGQCRFCLITDEHVDGDRIRWAGSQRNVCSRSQCMRRFQDEVTRELGRVERAVQRKRTPAEIHALKLEERRAKRRQYRLRKRGAA